MKTKQNLKKSIPVFLLLLIFSAFSSLFGQGTKGSSRIYMTFEDMPVGTLPAGWLVEGTRQKGPLATWKVIVDKSAPSGEKVLALTRTNHSFSGTFNLCWTKDTRFLNGEIRVKFKAVSGEEDEGGGMIWRAQDKNNYYIARYNPLENNFRIYYVKDGARRMLASARVVLPAGEWQYMKIMVSNHKMTGYLNGKKYLELTDQTFIRAGGVGVWTKADAVTSFDDFEVISSKAIRAVQ